MLVIALGLTLEGVPSFKDTKEHWACGQGISVPAELGWGSAEPADKKDIQIRAFRIMKWIPVLIINGRMIERLKVYIYI